MAEIDFDELDKAVNSLMDSATKKAAPQQEKTVSDSTTDTASPVTIAAPEPEQSVAEPEKTPEQPVAATLPGPVSEDSQPSATEEKSAAPSQTSLATKRRGQFMDMKHSSADMRTMPSPMAAKPVTRVGATIAPISNAVEPEETPTTPVAESSAPNPSVSESAVQESANKDETPLLDAPEPVDEIAAVSEKNDNTNDNESSVSEEADTAPTSPFLPDAKVEKRPLGTLELVAPESNDDAHDEQEQSSGDTPAPTAPTMTHGVSLDASTSAEPVAPATITTTLPKELHSSVLEVEADTTAATDTPEEDVKTPVESTSEVKDSSTSDATVAMSGVKANDRAVPDVAASIPPQYTAKKSAKDAEPQTSMYDNAVDHPALAQPKKTSHWTVVIVIIILVLLGALGGAALYLYQTGALSLI